jgi:hypothetical protein
MPSLDGLLIVVAAAFAAPFVFGLAPALRIPAVVLEIVAGIVLGPSVLGWVEVDATIEVLATIGLGFLLFLGGLEVDFARLRGRILDLALRGYALSFAIAVAVSLALGAGGLVQTPLLIAVALGSTSLGVLIPVLKDTGRIGSPLGRRPALAAHPRRPAAAAGHDRTDPRPRRDRPARRVRRRRAAARARGCRRGRRARGRRAALRPPLPRRRARPAAEPWTRDRPCR